MHHIGCSSEAASVNMGESHEKKSVEMSCDQVTGASHIKKRSVKMSRGVVMWVGPCSPILFRNMPPGESTDKK